MDSRVHAVADQLLLIERALRLLDLWSSQPPAPEALASNEPFAVDCLRFEEWLQWIFLPRMKLILESNQPLPSVSGILPMAEMVYAQRQGMHSLLESLRQFDQLIQG